MRLTRDQIEVVRKEAERYKEAVAELSKAQVTLWETRIDLALAVGEFDTSDLLSSPRDWNENCNCAAAIPGEEMIRGWRK
jgi:hypothetical protein